MHANTPDRRPHCPFLTEAQLPLHPLHTLTHPHTPLTSPYQVRDENVEAQFRALGETVGWGGDAPRDVRAMRASHASYASIQRQVSRATLPEPEHWPSRARVRDGRQGRAAESRGEPWSHRALESAGRLLPRTSSDYCSCQVAALRRFGPQLW